VKKEKNNMKIYVAASFAYEDKAKTSERKYLIEKTVERIQKFLPGDYYLPHQLKIPNAWDMSLKDWSKAVYEHDIKALRHAELIIFLSFGKENNAGSVWEVGYVFGRNTQVSYIYEQKLILVRMTNESESLMLTNSIERIIDQSEIEAYNWKTLPKYKTTLNRLS